jgi:hypothetical protein
MNEASTQKSHSQGWAGKPVPTFHQYPVPLARDN